MDASPEAPSRCELHGATRGGRDRAANEDRFAAFPELALFMVADGFGRADAADVAVEAFAAAVRAGGRSGDSLEVGARRAHEALLGRTGGQAGAEVAVLLLDGGGAEVLVCGSCRVYRARDLSLEVLTGTAWPSPPRCLGGGALAITRRRVDVRDGDTFVLTTDGFHRLADDDPAPVRDDPGATFVRSPLPELVSMLLHEAAQDDDATVLAVRLPREDRNHGLGERLARALASYDPDRSDRLAVRSARLRFPLHPPGLARQYPRLDLVLACASDVGRDEAHARARALAGWLETAEPDLGGPHEWSVEPNPVEPEAAAEERACRVREIVGPLIDRYRGLYLGPIEIEPAWGPRRLLRVTVVRDDEPGAADETTAARAIADALARIAPELSPDVRVIGEYCK